MTDKSDSEKVWELSKKVGTAMFVTRDGDGLEGRPLQGHPDADAHAIFFMTDAQHILDQLSKDDRVFLSFANPGGNDYVSIDGAAIATDDRAKIKELWNVWAKAYWDGPEDPKIRLITFKPQHARYWDAPNRSVAAIMMAAGIVTGKQPKLGSSGDVNL